MSRAARIIASSALVIALLVSACSDGGRRHTGAGTEAAMGEPIERALAERAASLIDAGPAGTSVLLPGAPDASRQFAAALALAPYQTIRPYLDQLAAEWSDRRAGYGPPDRPAVQAEATRMAALLARSAEPYRAVLFPPERRRALRARARRLLAAGESPDTRPPHASTFADAVASLERPTVDAARSSTTACDRMARAVLRGDLRAASRWHGPPGSDIRCGHPSHRTLAIVRAEAMRQARQIRDRRALTPGRIVDLMSRLAWTSAYPSAMMQAAQRPVADAIAGYLAATASASEPFLPNIPADQLRLMLAAVRMARPTWRPPRGHLAHLRRTLDWRGRLPERVRNDPTTFIYAVHLLARAPRAGIAAAVRDLRASLPAGSAGATALDTGLLAIAAQREELITDQLLGAAGAQVGNDPRLGARLAALVSYSRRCPVSAANALDDQLHAAPAPRRLSPISIYYYALIAHAAARCPRSATGGDLRTELAAVLRRRLPTMPTVPTWQNWLEPWLAAEAGCALGRPPSLDSAVLRDRAARMLRGPSKKLWQTFDPTTAYAVERSLDIAARGCANAWYTR